MTEQIIRIVEISVLVCFFLAIFYRLIQQSKRLKQFQTTGFLLGGCGFPMALFVVALLAGAGPAGPLFWPVFAALGAMLGTVLATLCFLCRKKTEDNQ